IGAFHTPSALLPFTLRVSAWPINRLGRCGSRSLAAPVNRGGASSLQNRYNSSQCKPLAGRPEGTRGYAAATDAGSNFAALRAMERGGSRCAAGLRRNSYPFCQHRVATALDPKPSLVACDRDGEKRPRPCENHLPRRKPAILLPLG